jgi:hypothetical protein
MVVGSMHRAEVTQVEPERFDRARTGDLAREA